ncbi:MAG TPA: Uma2 family endonuclease [Pyrinomonadaceae bacterium]|nr:Uma2 family endonuclease [Pyrinomonadaceae bacterium]
MTLKELSESQPDLVLAIPEETRYFDHHPTPVEVLLVLEIAGSSLEYDLGAKSRLYASAGIRQYWVLNLKSNELIDHREPGADGYHSRHTYGAGSSVSLDAFPEITVHVSELLPVQG